MESELELQQLWAAVAAAEEPGELADRGRRFIDAASEPAVLEDEGPYLAELLLVGTEEGGSTILDVLTASFQRDGEI